MSFYNFYKQLLENNQYLKNYTSVFIQINNKHLPHWSWSIEILIESNFWYEMYVRYVFENMKKKLKSHFIFAFKN